MSTTGEYNLKYVESGIDDEIFFENEEELTQLEYEGNDERPVFEAVKVTEKRGMEI